jgi:diaminopimelate epimerase
MLSPPPSTSWETERVQLSKHHGLGNDFLVVLDEVNGRALRVDGDLARRACDRRTGIGADGLIHGATPEPGSDATVVMHLYNADGSRAETSGNGIRCLAHAIALAREVNECTVFVDTDAGRKKVVIAATDPDDRTALARAYMGKVIPGPEAPVTVVARLAEPGPAQAARYTTADVGNPHLVVEVADPSKVDLADIGAWIDQQFPEGINVEFAAADAGVLVTHVWERGAGITDACGTGACAVAWAFSDVWGHVSPDDQIEVRMPGGDAYVALRAADAVLSGTVHHVATIELPDV